MDPIHASKMPEPPDPLACSLICLTSLYVNRMSQHDGYVRNKACYKFYYIFSCLICNNYHVIFCSSMSDSFVQSNFIR